MKRPIAYYGEPVLRKKGEPITEFGAELKELYQDMVETMWANNGMGLAAPQIFCSLSLFITAFPYEKEDGTWGLSAVRPFVNPKILAHSDQFWVHDESCISLPKLSGAVPRPFWVDIEAQDLDGNVFHERLEGWPARVFLHENDHVNGVLYIDRMNKKERKELEEPLRQIKKKSCK